MDKINLKNFWDSYLSKTEINSLALQNTNITGPFFDNNKMIISQSYPEQNKIYKATVNNNNKSIEMKIHDTITHKDDIVVRGEMVNTKLKPYLDEINNDETYSMRGEPIIVTIINEETLEYNFYRRSIDEHNDATVQILKFLINKELCFMKNDLDKVIKKNDIYFIQLTENTGRDAVSMPTDYPHLDLCAKDKYKTNLNKFCGVSSILYTNVTDKETKLPRIYPSASFFYGPEIPMQTEDFRLLEKKLETTPYDILTPGGEVTNFWMAFLDKNLDIPVELMEPLNKEQFNDKIKEYLKENSDKPELSIKLIKNMLGENMLSLFQNKMKRIFVSAPMMTSGWAVWKNEPSRLRKINWENIGERIRLGEETNETFDDKYILKIRGDAPNYYTHANVSKDSVWHISPHKALHNLTDLYTQPCIRKFVTLRLSNFNIYAGIRFIFILRENIVHNNPGKDDRVIDEIYKDIVISNLQVLSFYYNSIKIDFKGLDPLITLVENELTRLFGSINLERVSISDSERIAFYEESFAKIKSMKEAQCNINNIYKKFNVDNIVNGRNRNDYSSGLELLIAYLKTINQVFGDPPSGMPGRVVRKCTSIKDDESDIKLEDYYFKQKYLKYKSKYLQLSKMIKNTKY